MTDLEEARKFFNNDAYATRVTGIEITEVGPHFARVELDLDDRHRNALGAVMGGVYFTMSDFAFAIASNFKTDPCVTLASHISYLSAARGDHLICEARCIKDGKRTCFYEILVQDELGTDVAKISTEGYKIIR